MYVKGVPSLGREILGVQLWANMLKKWFCTRVIPISFKNPKNFQTEAFGLYRMADLKKSKCCPSSSFSSKFTQFPLLQM